MDAENWLQVKSLFNQLIELDVDAREAFIKQAECDQVIVEEALKLIVSVTQSTSELTVAVGRGAQAILVDRAPLDVGDTVGAYQIDECIGVGGMGAVFKAHRIDETIDHCVAIKLMHANLLHSSNADKFYSERQTLSRLQHRFIAKIFDAGETESGHPYMIMEYIEGEPLNEYTSNNRLSLQAKLQVFTDVCAAIQFAHQKGIIHRDLKPNNILVANEGGSAVPKIIDFGISHSMASSTLEKNNRELGTPQYMSPEQSNAEFLLDTRTDIYSLGVIFYEFLTGKLPHDGQLSARSDTVGGDGEGINVDIKAFNHASFADELACITKKALAFEPNARYQSVDDFKSDILRLLKNEPISAKPYSFIYHMKKRIARHKAQTVLLALLMVTLLTGSVVVSVALIRESKARVIAEQEQAKAELETQKALATQQFLYGVLSSPNDAALGKDVKVTDALDFALNNLNKQLKGQYAVQASILKAIAGNYMSFADYDKAEELFTSALSLLEQHEPDNHQSIIYLYNDLGQLESYRFNYAEAIAIYQQNIERIRRYLPVGHHMFAVSLNNIGSANFSLARDTRNKQDRKTYAAKGIEALTESIALQERYLEAENRIEMTYSQIILAHLYSINGQDDLAIPTFKQVIEALTAAHGEKHFYTLNAMSGLAKSYQEIGNLSQAEKHFRHVFTLLEELKGPAHPNTINSLSNVAKVLVLLEQWDEAESLYKEALRRTLEFDPNHVHYKRAKKFQEDLDKLQVLKAKNAGSY